MARNIKRSAKTKGIRKGAAKTTRKKLPAAVRQMSTRPVTGESAINRIAEEIRVDCIAIGDGEFLGSEDDLMKKYRTSRPTLRHAAAVVAREQLLTIRRGVGGGYFARRPESRTVAHAAAIYFRANNASVAELVHAFTPIRVELARLACTNASKRKLSALKKFLDREIPLESKQIPLRDFLTGEREFGRILGVLAGNNVLSLFLESLLDLASMQSRETDILINHPERVNEFRSQRNRLAQAVYDRDEKLAIAQAARLSRLSTKWAGQKEGRRRLRLG